MIGTNIKILLLSAVLAACSYPVIKIQQSVSASHHNSGSGIVVDFGVAHGEPVFNMDDFKPGDCVERRINVNNVSGKTKKIFIKTKNIVDDASLSSVLSIVIQSNNNFLFGYPNPKTLTDFYHQSTPDGIYLLNLTKNTKADFDIKICFDEDAGNTYQLTQTQFDLTFFAQDKDTPDPEIDLPHECQHLAGIITKVMHGTPNNDTINGTSANELIYSYDGNDKIYPGSGSDCVVTGNGNNVIMDVSGNDVFVTGNGNDSVKAGSGNDTIYSGGGNDILEGESGNDIVYGQEGDDLMKGGSGNDKLTGDDGNDTAFGDSGFDTCSAENKNSCEI
ncbi:hypothetical protein IPM62_03770 [Candidatus Woesebacteria bacterium]|nr:MAG: hypothetical protein IPM62_03770 [Candidatus Woesebacteria bacterium]